MTDTIKLKPHLLWLVVDFTTSHNKSNNRSLSLSGRLCDFKITNAAGNAFGRVCLSVSVHVCVCGVWALNFWKSGLRNFCDVRSSLL